MDGRKWGWKPDLPDHRDFRYSTHLVTFPETGAPVPLDVSVLAKMQPPGFLYDQGSLGSCTANSSLWMAQFVFGPPPGDTTFARMFTYVTSLIHEGAYPQDAGAQIRDVMKVIATFGLAPEAAMPYDTSKFPEQPSFQAISEAGMNVPQCVYTRLETAMDRQQCLTAGFPFVGGFTVYESFENDSVATTGIVPMPGSKESVLGGHAIAFTGYHSNFHGTGHDYYEFQNSWGPGWGDKGVGYLPAAYVDNANLADDFWTIRRVH